MQAGICRYEDKVWLADVDAIKSMMPSAIGKPVYIHHDEGTKESRLKNLKEEAAGYITESFYNELDSWFWFKFLAIDDKAHKAISQGWSVSNAYLPIAVAGGGTKNNCPYDSEVKSGEFTHLAIVPNPRYEEACIMSPEEFKAYQDEKKRQLSELQNSKTEGTTMFFRTKKEPVTAADNLKDEEVFTEIKNDDGTVTTVSLAELKNAKKGEKKNIVEEDDDDMMEDCDGEKVSRKDLKNAYKAIKANEKKNAEEDEKKKKEEEEKKNREKKNDEDEEEAKKKAKAKEEEEKKNSLSEEAKNLKHFEELRNAHLKTPIAAPVIEVPASSLKRGKDRYSLNKSA